MIIYIHGFNSSGMGTKALMLRNIYEKEGFIAPTLSNIPELAIETLKELIKSYLKYENVYLIGSSLGGYYATYLAEYFHIKAILINPSINPTITLQRYLGYCNSFYDDSSYQWNQGHMKMIESYEQKEISSYLYLVLLQTGDELLNYKEALSKYSSALTIVEEGGSHRFENIEKYIDKISSFCEYKI